MSTMSSTSSWASAQSSNAERMKCTLFGGTGSMSLFDHRPLGANDDGSRSRAQADGVVHADSFALTIASDTGSPDGIRQADVHTVFRPHHVYASHARGLGQRCALTQTMPPTLQDTRQSVFSALHPRRSSEAHPEGRGRCRTEQRWDCGMSGIKGCGKTRCSGGSISNTAARRYRSKYIITKTVVQVDADVSVRARMFREHTSRRKAAGLNRHQPGSR